MTTREDVELVFFRPRNFGNLFPANTQLKLLFSVTRNPNGILVGNCTISPFNVFHVQITFPTHPLDYVATNTFNRVFDIVEAGMHVKLSPSFKSITGFQCDHISIQIQKGFMIRNGMFLGEFLAHDGEMHYISLIPDGIPSRKLEPHLEMLARQTAGIDNKKTKETIGDVVLQNTKTLTREWSLDALAVWAKHYLGRECMSKKTYNRGRVERKYDAPGVGVVRSAVQFKMAVEKATNRNFLQDMKTESNKLPELVNLPECAFKKSSK